MSNQVYFEFTQNVPWLWPHPWIPTASPYLDPYTPSLSTSRLLNKNPCLLTRYKPCEKWYADTCA